MTPISGSLLESEHVLGSPVDPQREDLVEEFRCSPLGRRSRELQLWYGVHTRRRRHRPACPARGGRRAVACTRLSRGRRLKWQLAPAEEFGTRAECEWASLASRQRDETGTCCH